MAPVNKMDFVRWLQENCKEEFDQLYTRYLMERPEPVQEPYYKADYSAGVKVLKLETMPWMLGTLVEELDMKKKTRTVK